jgi:peptide/nickel transport system substrate-binding protein
VRRLVSILAVCAIVAAACGNSTATPTTGPAATTSTSTQTTGSAVPSTAASKDTMIIAIPGTPPGIDPDTQSAPQEWTIGAQLYGESGLRWGRAPYTAQQTIADPNKVPGFWIANTDLSTTTPGIVQSCTLTPDGSKVTMALRPGVKSAVGNELTTADLTWGLQRSVADKFIGAFFMGVGGAGDIAQWHAVDKYTEEIDQANGQSMVNLCPLLAHLGAAPSWIMDSTEAKKHVTSSDPWATDWINHGGSWFGAYYITDWEADKQVVLQANPNYYLAQPPIKKIIYQVVPQSADRIALLKAGKVDLVEGLSPTEAQALDNQSGVRPIAVQSNKQFFAFMNDSKPPFDNPLVRQALSYAVDRKTLADSIYHGLAVPYEGWLPVTYPGYQPFTNYDYDLTKAKALLAQAGLPNGFSTELSYSSGEPEEEQVAIAWQTSLAQIGVNLTLKKLPPSAISTMVVGGTATNFVFALWQDAPFLPDPVFSLQLWYASYGNAKWYHFADPKTDADIKTCGNVVDFAQRTSCIQTVAQYVSTLAPAVNIVAPDFIYAVTDKVSNANFNYGLSYVVEGMTITP